MNKRNLARIFFYQLIFSLLFLTACQKFFSIVPAQISGQELSGGGKNQLQSQLDEAARKIETLKALARVEVLYRDRNSSLRYALLAQRPDLLRIEGLPLNASYSLSVITAYANRLQLVDHTNRTVKSGELNAQSLESLLQIPASPGQLIDYLGGRFPALTEANSKLRYFHDAAAGVYHLNNYQNGSYWKIAADSLHLKEAQFKKTPESEPFLQIIFDYQKKDWPEQVTFVVPDKDLKIILKYQFFDFNRSINSSSFEVAIPEGYDLEHL